MSWNIGWIAPCLMRYGGWNADQSEHFFRLELKASNKQSFLKSMGQLLSSLEKYWKAHNLPEV